MNRILTFCIAILLFCTFQSKAQEKNGPLNFVNIKQGLSKVAVSAITQDNNGYIWIGTNGAGLYKFDGVDYTPYKHKIKDTTTINSNLIHCMYIDHKNRLWVGTDDGLSVYEKDLDRFTRIPFQSKKDAELNIAVFTLSGDAQGNIYIGSFENGYFGLKNDEKSIRRLASADPIAKNAVNINKLTVDHKNTIYAGTSLGLKEFDVTAQKFVSSYFNTSSGLHTFDEPVQTLLIDAQHHIWVGTVSNGLYKIVKGNPMTGVLDQIYHFGITERRILATCQMKDNSILVGTENDGLFQINQDGTTRARYLSDKSYTNSISSNSIWSLYVDKNDRVWMGYYNSGIGIYDELYDKFKGLESIANNKNSLEVGSVTGILEDDAKRLWITMDGGGIDIFNPKSNTYTHLIKNEGGYSNLSSSDIQTVFKDRKNNLWFGTWNHGLFLLPNGSKKFINYNAENTPEAFGSNSIMSFAEDAKGTIWIGTFYNGILSYNPNTETFVHHDTPEFTQKDLHTSAIRKVMVDSKDCIWVGTTKGLFRIKEERNSGFKIDNISEKAPELYRHKSSANYILSLYEDNDGSIWIGTRGSGLGNYNPQKQSFNFCNETFNLNEESVASITSSDAQTLWISGNTGITRIDLKNKKATNYSANDGLLSNNFNFNAVLKANDGMLYFGNYKGLDFFNPKNVSVNESLTSMYLTGFKLFNKDVIPGAANSPLDKIISETETIELTHNQSVFTIEYTGINYTRAEKNTYAYYLEGFEDTWNYVGTSRSATYTNLDPGKYTFKLKAANNDGIWNENALTLKVHILPPWWKTNLATAIYILLLALGIYLLNKITQERIKEKQFIKNERIKRIQEDRLNEKKLQFFTNISHEFRTPLTLIINPLEDIIRDETLNLPERVKEKHHIIHKNTDRLYRLINELMDFRKLELNKLRVKAGELDVVEFTKEVTSYFKEEAANRNIHLAVDADVTEIPIWADANMLEKIIFNILSNALKVTPDGGAINIDIVSSDKLIALPLADSTQPIEAIEIIITDTGMGLEKDQVQRIFERFYQVENLNKTYYGGTGIGLEVVQNFLELHKGKVEVESEVGKGTSFKLFFPKGKAHFAAEDILKEVTKSISYRERNPLPKKAKATEDGSSEDYKSKQHTLLVVEDNSELRNYLRDEFKQQYKVLVAKDGQEGLKMAKEFLPDVILTDVIMPEMDGFTFCKNIKEDLRTSHIPLLMLTAKAKIDDRIEGIGLGADAYMVKPFDMRLLSLRLKQLITSRQLIFDKYFGSISGADENANASSLDKDFIHKVLNYINENMSDSDLSVEVLASQLHLSRSQLYRKIKTLTGQTVNEFLRKIRLQRAKQIIETESDVNISEVCYKVGFSSPSYFTKCFKAHFGVLPTEIEKNK
ncbi:two-component regulator propeller domain-containing protein [Cellulophaga baltica]|uniref:two-component regulator propeller domain-containing protein n=1 Tax=Cellulophaga baltica TaxID=76594 RepID=UPI002493DEC2|nr:two-component regulator propeller domain-containing protein [Cellulophaga baltica]